MILLLLSFVGGMLTILSPCILPVLPFVFARVGQPFLRSGLPLLAGMAASFAAVGLLAGVGGGWAVQANEAGRSAALALLALFGLALLFPAPMERLSQPLVRLGSRLAGSAERGAGEGSGTTIGSSALLGVATGLLWAPCAGPILGLVLTIAAIEGPGANAAALLLAYSLGAGTSLALALLAGGRVARLLRRSLGAGAVLRRGLGGAVVLSVAAIATGLDKGPIARVALASGTMELEQALIAKAPPQRVAPVRARPRMILPVLGVMPPLQGGVAWIQSPPLSREQLRGKVVLVNFWTYSCINCLRSLPYVKAWEKKYRPHGLVVVGVHTPEFAFEKEIANVKEEVKKLGITYPVVLDNSFTIWRAFENRYWPAFYFVDAQGRIRRIHFGEGEYDKSEQAIQSLLEEAGRSGVPGGLVRP